MVDLLSLSWLSIPDRVDFFKLVLIFKIRKDLAPRYLVPSFISVSDSHSHFTRGSNFNYRLPRSLAQAPNSFAFTAIRSWNGLPDSIKGIESLMVFKRRLKEYLFSRYA